MDEQYPKYVTSDAITEGTFLTSGQISVKNLLAADHRSQAKKQELTHRLKAILTLCETIEEQGQVRNGCTITNTHRLKFGKLFELYNNDASKLTNLLQRARKLKFIDFQGEILYQPNDIDVPVFLRKPIQSIRIIIREEIRRITEYGCMPATYFESHEENTKAVGKCDRSESIQKFDDKEVEVVRQEDGNKLLGSRSQTADNNSLESRSQTADDGPLESRNQTADSKSLESRSRTADNASLESESQVALNGFLENVNEAAANEPLESRSQTAGDDSLESKRQKVDNVSLESINQAARNEPRESNSQRIDDEPRESITQGADSFKLKSISQAVNFDASTFEEQCSYVRPSKPPPSPAPSATQTKSNLSTKSSDLSKASRSKSTISSTNPFADELKAEISRDSPATSCISTETMDENKTKRSIAGLTLDSGEPISWKPPTMPPPPPPKTKKPASKGMSSTSGSTEGGMIEKQESNISATNTLKENIDYINGSNIEISAEAVQNEDAERRDSSLKMERSIIEEKSCLGLTNSQREWLYADLMNAGREMVNDINHTVLESVTAENSNEVLRDIDAKVTKISQIAAPTTGNSLTKCSTLQSTCSLEIEVSQSAQQNLLEARTSHKSKSLHSNDNNKHMEEKLEAKTKSGMLPEVSDKELLIKNWQQQSTNSLNAMTECAVLGTLSVRDTKAVSTSKHSTTDTQSHNSLLEESFQERMDEKVARDAGESLRPQLSNKELLTKSWQQKSVNSLNAMTECAVLGTLNVLSNKRVIDAKESLTNMENDQTSLKELTQAQIHVNAEASLKPQHSVKELLIKKWQQQSKNSLIATTECAVLGTINVMGTKTVTSPKQSSANMPCHNESHYSMIRQGSLQSVPSQAVSIPSCERMFPSTSKEWMPVGWYNVQKVPAQEAIVLPVEKSRLSVTTSTSVSDLQIKNNDEKQKMNEEIESETSSIFEEDNAYCGSEEECDSEETSSNSTT